MRSRGQGEPRKPSGFPLSPLRLQRACRPQRCNQHPASEHGVYARGGEHQLSDEARTGRRLAPPENPLRSTEGKMLNLTNTSSSWRLPYVRTGWTGRWAFTRREACRVPITGELIDINQDFCRRAED